jgi:hypothetical protein
MAIKGIMNMGYTGEILLSSAPFGVVHFDTTMKKEEEEGY